MRKLIHSPIAALTLVTYLFTTASTANADDGAKGTIKINGQPWQVVDAIAYQETGVLPSVKVMLSNVPYNRGKMARDNKLDGADFFMLDGEQLELKIRPEGADNCYRIRSNSGGSSQCDSTFLDAFTVSRNDAQRVSGKIDWTGAKGERIEVSFDLPVLSKMTRPGKALSADGGAPGKAVLAHVAAMASGDFAQIKAVSDPERVAMMDAAKAEEIARMLPMMKKMTPTAVAITGGVIDGENAEVDFRGTRAGKAITGLAELKFVKGQWFVRGISTRE